MALRRWLALGPALLLLLPAAASAQGSGDEDRAFDRTGVYAGASLVVAVNTFERDVQRKVGLDFSTSEAIGIDARLGYRFRPHWAAELQVEYVNPFNLDSDVAGNFRVEPTVVTGNGKLYLAGGAWQPYFTVGGGFMHVDIRDKGAGVSDENDVGFVLRVGGGLEHYITEWLVLTAGASYVLPLSGRAEDFDYVSLEVLGLTYRF